CGRCRMCLRESYSFCEAGCDVTGGTVDGGHAELAVVDAAAAALVPEEPDASQLAPLLCAGYTVYSALREAAVEAGEDVAVVGAGGRGHLAVQYARVLGARVCAVTTTGSKRAELAGLGADEVVVCPPGAAGSALRERGGVDAILM